MQKQKVYNIKKQDQVICTIWRIGWIHKDTTFVLSLLLTAGESIIPPVKWYYCFLLMSYF